MKTGICLKRICLLAALLVFMGSALPMQAQRSDRTELDGTPISAAVYSAYEANWRKYARYACKVGEGYGYIPDYNRRYDSSLGMTATQYMKETKVVREIERGNLTIKRQYTIPREDAEAWVRALHSSRVGSYGYVDSAQIVKILDDNRMLVKSLWLVNQERLREQYAQDKRRMEQREGEVNEEQLAFDYGKRIELKQMHDEEDNGFTQTFLLMGYDTRGLREGERWHGPGDDGFQVGVIRWQELETGEAGEDEGRRSRRSGDSVEVPVLSALEQPMRRGVDGEQFKELLAERGMTVAGFVDMMRDLREKDRANAEERIHNALLAPEPAGD